MAEADCKSEENTLRDKIREKQGHQEGRLKVGMLILLLILNVAVSGGSVYVYDRYFAQKVAVIDIRGYMLDRKKLFLAGSITERQFTESVDEIEKALLKTDKRTVVLLGDAVVRNAEKITIDN